MCLRLRHSAPSAFEPARASHSWAALLLLALLPGPGAANAQDSGVRFYADVRRVVVDVLVLSAAGTPVTGLSAGDFEVLDNGAPAEVIGFANEDLPLDLVLLLDVSGSMKPTAEALAATSGTALETLRAEDRVALLTFSKATRVRAGLTSDHATVGRALAALPQTEAFRSATHIIQAVRDAAAYLRGRPSRDTRRVILILTDNIGIGRSKRKAALKELWEADAVLDALVFKAALPAAMVKYSPINWALNARIDPLVRDTGGAILATPTIRDDIGNMLDRARRRYTLYCRPAAGAAAGSRRSIRVKLKPEAAARIPGAAIIARRGYLVP